PTPRTTIELIPESAPFSAAQRALLNGFFSKAFGFDAPVELAPDASTGGFDGDDGKAPWHDPALTLDQRMELSHGRPLRRRMMAAMGQQDCGQCGYTCEEYANSIALQAEPRLNLCVPGGKATARMLKALVEEMGGGVLDPEEQAAKIAARPAKRGDDRPGHSRDRPVLARLVGCRRLNSEASQKATYHVEFDLSEGKLEYAVGDSLGIL